MTTCPLCQPHDENIVYQNQRLRVIAVHNETNAPAVCRVIWHEHIAEMTDLNTTQRAELMEMVYRVERAMRDVLRPDKINLASLGNQVPHLHWHIIARFQNDACFPAPIWVNAVRSPSVDLPHDWAERIAKQLLD